MVESSRSNRHETLAGLCRLDCIIIMVIIIFILGKSCSFAFRLLETLAGLCWFDHIVIILFILGKSCSFAFRLSPLSALVDLSDDLSPNLGDIYENSSE